MNDLKNKFKNDSNILAVYHYGSLVYKTNNEKSDIDLIMVVENNNLEVSDFLKNQSLKNIDITIYDKVNFEKLVLSHEISVLECLFLKDEYKIKENVKWNFDLSLQELRRSCSEKASNSWVKAKKKLIIEQDYNLYIGQKSAWHSLRILNFAQQIAKNGKIEDYTSMNFLLPKILQCMNWEELNLEFKKTYNEESSKFKALAPKEIIKSSFKR